MICDSRLLLYLLPFLASCAAGVPPSGEGAIPTSASADFPPRQEIELADSSLTATETARSQLKYVAHCALPDTITLTATRGHERFAFHGQLGLAPAWLSRSLTSSEERWISACLLALTNQFGKHVQVSLRANPAPVPFLKETEEEAKTFSLFEGGFFGNVFGSNPVAYACAGSTTTLEAQDSILQDRVCTKASGSTTQDGKTLTPCRFILTGSCADPASFTVDGHTYREVVFVYLKPTQ